MTLIRTLTRLANIFRRDNKESRYLEVCNEFSEKESEQIFAIAKKHRMSVDEFIKSCVHIQLYAARFDDEMRINRRKFYCPECDEDGFAAGEFVEHLNAHKAYGHI